MHYLVHFIIYKQFSIMAEPTSDELEKKLREEGYKRDEQDRNRYDRPGTGGGTEKVWTNGDYSRTEDDSTYRKNR